jgi:hypothetical protein
MASPDTSTHFLQLSIPTRDPHYYIPDGNVILLVEATLFRVHRSRLTKDKSMFDSMFGLTPDTTSGNSPLTPAPSIHEGDVDEVISHHILSIIRF